MKNFTALIYRASDPDHTWTQAFHSLKELVKFAEEHGEIILTPGKEEENGIVTDFTITIYDAPLE